MMRQGAKWCVALLMLVAIRAGAQVSAGAATQPTEFDVEGAFERAGEEFDVAAYVKTLPAVDFDATIRSLGAIPTLDEIIATADGEAPATQRAALAATDRDEIEALEKKIRSRRARGRYGQALPLAQKVVDIRRRVQAADAWEVQDAAISVATITAAMAMRDSDRELLALADRYDASIEGLYNQGRNAEAYRIVRSQVAVRRRLLGAEHPLVAKGLNNLAAMVEAQRDVSGAQRLVQEALRINVMRFEGDHPQKAHAFLSLAYLRDVGAALEVSETLGRAAVAMHQRLYPEGDASLATNLNNLGSTVHQRGDRVRAEALYQAGLKMQRRLLPADHTDIARSLHNLAAVRRDRGDLVEAESASREALAICMRVLPVGHPHILRNRQMLGDILRRRGKLDEAQALFEQSLEAARSALWNEPMALAGCLDDLANVLKLRGDARGARALYREALGLRRQRFAPDDLWIATSLMNVAYVSDSLGDLGEAEPMAREALAIYRRHYPEANLSTARCLNHLGGIVHGRGDLVGAIELNREALAMCKKLFSGDSQDTAGCLHSLGMALVDRGDAAEAEPLFRESLAMQRRMFPRGSQPVSLGVSGLAYALRAKGDMAGVEALLRESVDSERARAASGGQGLSTCLNNLAMVLFDRGNAAEAEPLLREAVELDRKQFGEEHVYVARKLSNLGAVLGRLGRNSEALTYLREAFALDERMRTQIVGAEQERAAFAERLGLTHMGATLATALVRTGLLPEALGVLERARGRSMLDLLERCGRDMEKEARGTGHERAKTLDAARAVEESVRLELASAENELIRLRREQDATSKNDSPDDKAASRDAAFASAQQRVVALRGKLREAGMTAMLALRGLYPESRPKSAEEIQTELSPGEIVLCYLWDDRAVLLLTAPRRGEGDIRAYVLAEDAAQVGDLGQLAGRVQEALSRSSGRSIGDLRGDAEALGRRLLPDAARAEAQRAARWVIVPDGPLNGIPFEALTAMQDPPDRGISGRDIAYAASASAYLGRREAARRHAQSRRAGEPPSLLAVGDPLFEPAPDVAEPPAEGVALAAVLPDGQAARQGLRPGDVILAYDGQPTRTREALVAQIDSTQRAGAARSAPVEVKYWRRGRNRTAAVEPGKLGVTLDAAERPKEALAFLSMRTRGIEENSAEASALDQVRLFGGALRRLPGTRREVESIAKIVRDRGGSATVLLEDHATVGEVAAAAAGRRFVHLATHGITGSMDCPYDASLALTRPKRANPDDIGFLRIEDLVRGWRGRLDGCDLVVLSACETQRGIRKGDSVMALPWGFFYAGAPTVVASLWKVDDTATQLLMTRFYENLVGQDRMPTAAALREAKQWVSSLNWAEAERRSGMTPDEFAQYRASRGADVVSAPRAARVERPFEHPYYWAAFVLVGDPG